MKKTWFIGFLALVVLISGCTSGPDTTSQPTATQSQPTETPAQPKATPPKQTATPPPTTAVVENIDFGFYPLEIVIARGGTVTWKQKDTEQHTVTGADFNSGRLSQGQTFSHTFNEAGTFDYWCTIHASMRGKVIVR